MDNILSLKDGMSFQWAASMSRDMQLNKPCAPTGHHWRLLLPLGSYCPPEEADKHACVPATTARVSV